MKQINRIVSIFIAVSMLVATALTVMPVTQARAATFTVTTTADTDDGTCDSNCSLREAIDEANSNGAGSDTITLPAGTYTLTLGDQLPVVTTTIIIEGTTTTTIQAAASPDTSGYRIFEVTGDLTLNNVTLKNGWCNNNLACAPQGGANQDTYKGYGGAIFNSGTLTITNSIIQNNKAAGDGGGIYNYQGTLSLTNTTVSNNNGSSGGGVGGKGTINVTNGTFGSNTANSGGGISSSDGTLNVTNSLFTSNSVTGNGGGIGSNSTLNIKTSTFTGNSASSSGGGLSSNNGPSNISNSTFTNNNASSRGGGIFNYEDLNLTNNTISGNSAPNGGGFYSDPYQHEGDSIYAVVVLKNNIFANSTSGGDCFNYVNGAAHPVTGNNNLIETEGSNPCGTTAPITGSDPNLGTLTGTPGHLPLNAGSPAINAGDTAACAAAPVSDTSQNGVARGTPCDVGSYESGGAPTFVDVPFDHPLWKYIEALYQGGFTAGCTATPLAFCPDTILDRAQSAVFMLRGVKGAAYLPPPGPWTNFVNESWVGFEWANGWADAMYVEGLTSGCQASPLKFCPANQLPRVEASIFGLKMKYGNNYVPPPATGTMFADFPSTDPSYWGIAWAEKAFTDGLLPACGTDPVSGKPMFCPGVLVTRAWGAYLIVKAKGLPTP
ncbi:MAG: CSLREA domain-containing protein [Chloroflexi bacterium]|nr:CSLREA domain-containing protein [Chloroflexota bacterium]